MFQTKRGSAKRWGPLHSSDGFLWLDHIYLHLASTAIVQFGLDLFRKWRTDTLSLCDSVFFFLLRLMTVTIGWTMSSSSPLLSLSNFHCRLALMFLPTVLLCADWRYVCIYTCGQCGRNVFLTTFGSGFSDQNTIGPRCVLSVFTPVLSHSRALSICQCQVLR